MPIIVIHRCVSRSCRLQVKTTGEGKILYRRGTHNHEAMPALVQVCFFFCLFSQVQNINNHNHEVMSILTQVQKLEAKKLEEILRNPETANAKNLLFSISKEILNPEMAAFASSYQTIRVKLRRRLKKMNKVSAEVNN